MRGPPNPQTQRAALVGSPVAQDQNKPGQIAEALAERQAGSLRRAFRLFRATFYTIASLAFAVSR